MQPAELALVEIKREIEKMSKEHQLRVLQILRDDEEKENVKLNVNKNGVFVNLTFLPATTLSKLRDYIAYYQDQERCLSIHETQKRIYQEQHFSNSNNLQQSVHFY